MSLLEALDSFSHIELTEEEMQEAIFWRKQKKDAVLKQIELDKKIAENRKRLTSSQWSYDQTRSFMFYRAHQIFPDGFILDDYNQPIFELMCYYFSLDEKFLAFAENLGVKNPSLDKGIVLAGNFGVGKTTLMKLFMKNQRQVYIIQNAKKISDSYEKDGNETIEEYFNKRKNAFNDPAVFYQEYSGICIDDLGTENVKSNYGNKKNVIGDIIEMRYERGVMGKWFHATTNLSSDQLSEFYGGRVVSRLRETVNFIELNGNDRRR
jgi:DNA replication protein DnaC